MDVEWIVGIRRIGAANVELGGRVMNFRQLDLNLLRVLCAIYRTGSVTEAGQQLALSQSATSNALARLRHCFGDALFVRSPSGLHPTRLAQRVAPLVADHLLHLEAALCEGESFEPASAGMHWRLSLSDLGEMMFLPALARELRRSSPGSRLSNEAVDAARVSAALEAREIDLAIGMLQADHQGVLGELLFREHYVALTARDWQPATPAIGRRLERSQLSRAALALAAPTASLLGSVQRREVDALREGLGHQTSRDLVGVASLLSLARVPLGRTPGSRHTRAARSDERPCEHRPWPRCPSR